MSVEKEDSSFQQDYILLLEKAQDILKEAFLLREKNINYVFNDQVNYLLDELQRSIAWETNEWQQSASGDC